MQITMSETGIDDLLRRLDNLSNSGRYRFVRVKALRAGIRVAERHAKASLEGSRSGRIYRIRGKEHQASAPGEAPAVDTGNLKGSIKVGEVTEDHAVLETNADYAAYLEFGTRYMAARPFMRPSVENHLDEIEAAMAAVINEALDS